MKDAYQVLGLSPGVNAQEIKRAFRRLAMRWHPDRNADPAAIEHFKVLRAAYERLLAGLGDGAAREAEQAAEPPPKRPREKAPPRDEEAPRGADRIEELAISLEEAWLGCEKLVQREQPVPCPHCHGSGEVELTHSRLCSACLGSGRVRTGTRLAACEACGGRGYRRRAGCGTCDGSGLHRRGRAISVRVPPAVRAGDELRVAGEGEHPGDGRGVPGDLRLRVAIEPHPLYRLEGRDLFLSRPVSALRLLLGGEVEVPLPSGIRRIKVPAGAAELRELWIEGAGFPGRCGEPAGALRVQLVPLVPRSATPPLRDLIAEVEAELARDPGRHLPELAQWEARWLKGASRES